MRQPADRLGSHRGASARRVRWRRRRRNGRRLSGQALRLVRPPEWLCACRRAAAMLPSAERLRRVITDESTEVCGLRPVKEMRAMRPLDARLRGDGAREFRTSPAACPAARRTARMQARSRIRNRSPRAFGSCSRTASLEIAACGRCEEHARCALWTPACAGVTLSLPFAARLRLLLTDESVTCSTAASRGSILQASTGTSGPPAASASPRSTAGIATATPARG